MPDISQLSFSLEEVTAALAKENNVTSGKWALGFDLGVGIGNFPTNPDVFKSSAPGVAITINRVTITKIQDGSDPAAIPAYVLDLDKGNLDLP